MRDSKKAELYEHLFQSLKAGLGIDILEEPEDPVKAYYDRCERGEYDPNPMSMMVSFRMCKDKEKFLTGYPEKLRDHLWEICERVMKDEK